MMYLSPKQIEKVQEAVKKHKLHIQEMEVHIGNVKNHFKNIVSELLINTAQIHDIESGLSSTEELSLIKFQIWAMNLNVCRRASLLHECIKETNQSGNELLNYHEEWLMKVSENKEALLDAMQDFINKERKNESVWDKIASIFN